MSSAQIGAVVTWVYAAGFGLPVFYVATHLIRTGALPTFFNLFPMYGGPWFAQVGMRAFVMLLVGFLCATVAAAWAGWLLWQESRIGGVLSLAILPVEAVFWVGFALPIPWVLGAVRAAMVVLAWRTLD